MTTTDEATERRQKCGRGLGWDPRGHTLPRLPNLGPAQPGCHSRRPGVGHADSTGTAGGQAHSRCPRWTQPRRRRGLHPPAPRGSVPTRSLSAAASPWERQAEQAAFCPRRGPGWPHKVSWLRLGLWSPGMGQAHLTGQGRCRAPGQGPGSWAGAFGGSLEQCCLPADEKTPSGGPCVTGATKALGPS